MKFGLHSLKDMVPNEACLYGCINWCLAQVQQQSSMGLSQSFPLMRGGKARPNTGFCFNIQKGPVLEFSGASFGKETSLRE